MRSIQIATLLVATMSTAVTAQDADLIVRNALIWTGDSARPRAEALAVRGERLLVVGTNAQADARRATHTRVIDAGGRFITPGFIDDHTHFAQAGALLIGANLLDVHAAGPIRRAGEGSDATHESRCLAYRRRLGRLRGQPGQQHRSRESPSGAFFAGSLDHRLHHAEHTGPAQSLGSERVACEQRGLTSARGSDVRLQQKVWSA